MGNRLDLRRKRSGVLVKKQSILVLVLSVLVLISALAIQEMMADGQLRDVTKAIKNTTTEIDSPFDTVLLYNNTDTNESFLVFQYKGSVLKKSIKVDRLINGIIQVEGNQLILFNSNGQVIPIGIDLIRSDEGQLTNIKITSCGEEIDEGYIEKHIPLAYYSTTVGEKEPDYLVKESYEKDRRGLSSFMSLEGKILRTVNFNYRGNNYILADFQKVSSK